jgi:hypothetical protein
MLCSSSHYPEAARNYFDRILFASRFAPERSRPRIRKRVKAIASGFPQSTADE